jgi:signal transduction histidine kinase
MRINLKRMIVALAAIAFFGTGSVFASPPAPSPESSTYLSGRASTLLVQIQAEAARLRRNAGTLETFASNPQYSWQSHADYLNTVKSHINAVGERTAELQRIQHAVLPWQQQAITEVTSHASQVANSTQAAILYLSENKHWLFVPEYRDHVTTIADSSRNMKQTVDKFLDYERAQQKFQQLQNELELAGD